MWRFDPTYWLAVGTKAAVDWMFDRREASFTYVDSYESTATQTVVGFSGVMVFTTLGLALMVLHFAISTVRFWHWLPEVLKTLWDIIGMDT